MAFSTTVFFEGLETLLRDAGIETEHTQEQADQFVRFYDKGKKLQRSLNFWFDEKAQIYHAHFVFRVGTGDDKLADREAFIGLFGGTVGRSHDSNFTAFAELVVPKARSAWLMRVIQGYWAMGQAEQHR